MRRSILAWVSVFSLTCISLAACGDGERDVLPSGGTGGDGTGGDGTGGDGTGGSTVVETCPEDQTECSGLCVSTESDRNNCGACGETCGDGELCVNGACEVSCPDGLLACENSCIDPMTDPEYCGATSCDDMTSGMGGMGGTSGSGGTECGPGEACVSGMCRTVVLGWSEAARVDEATTEVASEYDIASDSLGNAIAMWRQRLDAGDPESKRIFVSRFDAETEEWSTPERIDDSTLDVRNPSIAMSADGQAVAAWVEGDPWIDGADGSSDGADSTFVPNRVVAAHFDGTVWQDPVRLDDDPDPDADTGSTCDFPEAAMDADGDGIVIWSQSGTISPTSEPTTFELYKNEFTDGSFDGAVSWGYADGAHNNVRVGADHENIAVNSAGQAFVIWQEGTSTTDLIPVVSVGTLGGSWSSPMDLRETTDISSGSASVGMDDAGNAVASWTGGDNSTFQQRFFRRVYESGAWQDESEYGRSDLNLDLRVARIGVSRDGARAIVILEEGLWSNSEGDHVEFQLVSSRYSSASDTWTIPSDLGPTQGARTGGAIVMDGLGNALVGWNDQNAASVRQYLADPQIWTDTTQLAEPLAGTPAVAASPSGAAFAIWVKDDQLLASRLQ